MTPPGAAIRREEMTLHAPYGGKLFERKWLPGGDARAVIVVVHGYAEHTGRYDHVGADLAGRGYVVRGFDLRGHGLSDGPRALVSSFREFLDDLRWYLPRVRGEHPGLPVFVLGHSMGGAITALWLAVDQPAVDGALLSGAVPPRGDPRTPLTTLIAWLGKVAPRLPLVQLDAGLVSRDPEEVRRYEGDPLVFRGRIKAGMAAATVRAAERLHDDAPRIIAPILIMHGTADGLTAPDGSRRLYERISSADRTLKLYDGLYHEILNEPERAQVLDDIAAWLGKRVASASGWVDAAS